VHISRVILEVQAVECNNAVETRHLALLMGGSESRRFNLGYSAFEEKLHLVSENQLNGVWEFHIK
jgi:hypothetical protein